MGPVYVSVDVRVWWWFKDLKRIPPMATCHESWMKTGAEWHNGTSMCWILPEEWRDAMAWPGKPVNDILTEGREWLLNNVRCLISRHYAAHLEGIEEWPEEWAYWDHFEGGAKQYARERRKTR